MNRGVRKPESHSKNFMLYNDFGVPEVCHLSSTETGFHHNRKKSVQKLNFIQVANLGEADPFSRRTRGNMLEEIFSSSVLRANEFTE